MKLRRNYFSPTWRIKNSHVEISDFPRGYWYVGSFGGRSLCLSLARGVDLEEERKHQREAPERGASIAEEGERDADDGH